MKRIFSYLTNDFLVFINLFKALLFFMKRLLFLLAGFLLLTFSASAQIENPVRWIYSAKQVSPQEYELIFKASIQEPWHMYSQDIPMAPPATTFKFDKDSAFTLEGKVAEKGKVIKEYDKNFRMNLKFYNDSATFIQKVKLNAKGAVVKGAITFMSCNDTQCLPPQDLDFSFTLGKMSTPEQAVISATDNGSSKITIGGNKKTLWGFFILAFLGGLVAIVTPCVFPMIPMTVSFFLKDGENKAKNKIQALLYGLSIIVIYTLIGSVLSVIAGPNIANFLSTHWLPNIIFFLIFTIFDVIILLNYNS